METIKVRDFYAELEESEIKGVTKMICALIDKGHSSVQIKPAAIEAGLTEEEFNRIIKEMDKKKPKKKKALSKDKPTS